MSEIKNALLGICMLAIASGMLKMLIPDNKYKVQISFLIACVFAVSFFSFIGNIKVEQPDFSAVYQSEAVDFQDKLTENAINRASKAIREKVGQLLAENSVKFEKIYVIAHTDDDFCISINELELVFSEEASDAYIENALNIVRREVGSEIKVSFSRV